ncbi:MAG: acetate--CoA ligase family protein [Pseudomonadota bacterium]
MTTLDDLIRPRSLAVVGASDNPARIGGRPLNYFLNYGFEGDVYAVNPNRDTVQGLTAYPSLTDVPADTLDFVLVVVPAPQVVDVVREAAAKKAKCCMIFSSGFAEVSEQGAAWQAEITQIARETGTRVIGPNCLGMFNHAHRFYPTFTGVLEYAAPLDGHIGVASQSGAYGSHIYFVARRKGLGVNYWLTTGNECDLHTSEVIRLMAEAEDVHTIMAYVESVKDGDTLIDALQVARANRKPVVMMKVGHSDVGAEAASSHTASLAGEDAIYDAVLKEGGAYRARSTEEMLDVAIACRPRIYPTGKKVGLVTISGGGGILMADAASDNGLDVAPMPDDAQAAIKEVVPFAGTRNPVDVTAQFFNDLSLIDRFTELMLDKGGYDGLVGFWTSVAGNPKLSGELIARLNKATAGRDDTLFIQSVIGPDEIIRQYEEEGYPCVEDPSRAVGAMAAAMFFGESFARGTVDAPAVPDLPPLPDGPLGEHEAKAILAAAGLPMVQDILVKSGPEAKAAVADLQGPAAMKIASADILHKTEAGGVALHVTEDLAAQTYNQLTQNATHYDAEARIDGVLVSPMVNGGVELILGAKVDPVFGAVVMVGLGGVFTEIFADISFRKAPVSEATARDMLEELRGAKLLKGYRGKNPVDLDATSSAISRLSLFAAAHADVIESVEMNPVRARAHDCMALDALIVRRS